MSSRRDEFNLGTFNPGHAMREYHHITMDYVHDNESQRHRFAANDSKSGTPKSRYHLQKSKDHLDQAVKAGKKRDKVNSKTRKIKPAKMETLTRPKHRNLANDS